MAKADLIAQQLVSVEDAAHHFNTFVTVLLDAAGDQPPSWVIAVQNAFDPVSKSLESLGRHVRRDVIPHLQDIDRFNGGMGAVAPMVTRVDARPSAHTRK